MDITEAAARAADQVLAVGESTGARLALAGAFYRDGLARYGRAELSFLRWEISRGVLDASSGSPWWRAVNDRLLRDKTEADLLTTTGSGRASTRSVELWVEFAAAPTPAGWYRAHNASVVSGYLEHEDLAAAELPAERFMINVALLRVLYTHLLAAEPQAALGRLARLGPRLADPRRGSVGLFLDLRSAFPHQYPLTGFTVGAMLGAEGRLARTLDYAIIVPRMAGLYDFGAVALEQPGLTGLFRDGSPCYATATHHRFWTAPRPAHRLITTLTGTRSRR
ncbi:MAG: hypothetical protein ABIS86_18660 [Streptosporangiaceae bacterium]